MGIGELVEKHVAKVHQCELGATMPYVSARSAHMVLLYFSAVGSCDPHIDKTDRLSIDIRGRAGVSRK